MNENDLLGTLFPLLLIVLAFWFLVIRPAKKRQQEMTRIQNSVAVGSEVMLGSGIFGTVVSVGDETLTDPSRDRAASEVEVPVPSGPPNPPSPSGPRSVPMT